MIQFINWLVHFMTFGVLELFTITDVTSDSYSYVLNTLEINDLVLFLACAVFWYLVIKIIF